MTIWVKLLGCVSYHQALLCLCLGREGLVSRLGLLLLTTAGVMLEDSCSNWPQNLSLTTHAFSVSVTKHSLYSFSACTSVLIQRSFNTQMYCIRTNTNVLNKTSYHKSRNLCLFTSHYKNTWIIAQFPVYNYTLA